ERQESPGLGRRIRVRIKHEAGAARNGDEILAANALAGFLCRNLRPALDLVAIGHGEFGAFGGYGAVEVIPFEQQCGDAVAEIGEGAVAAIGQKLGALVTELFVDIDGLVEVQGVENALALDDELAVFVDDGFACAQQQQPIALHGGGFAHGDAGIDLEREAVGLDRLDGAGGVEQFFPGGRLPGVGVDAGFGQDILADVDHPHVGAERNAVIFAVIEHEGARAFGEGVPAGPIVDFGAGDLVERLQQAPFNEGGNEEAVEGGNVGARAGGEIESQLLGELGILAAELVEADIHARIGGLESGDDAVLDPFGGGAVDAADDAAAGDIEIDGEGWRGHSGGANKTKRESAQTIAHSNTSHVWLRILR